MSRVDVETKWKEFGERSTRFGFTMRAFLGPGFNRDRLENLGTAQTRVPCPDRFAMRRAIQNSGELNHKNRRRAEFSIHRAF
jgi:hypothetical protein